MYEVRVAGLPQEFYLQSVYLGAEEAASKKVKLDFPGAQSSRLELRLSSDGAQINGTVSEDDNKPAAGFMVALVPNADFRDDQQLFRNVVTDQNGKFTIRGIAPGAYKLFAWDDIATDAYMNPEFLRPYENQGTSVTLLANDRKTVELRIIKSKAPVS
jgi:hypothetical protein